MDRGQFRAGVFCDYFLWKFGLWVAFYMGFIRRHVTVFMASFGTFIDLNCDCDR